jgi:hypothetical protein
MEIARPILGYLSGDRRLNNPAGAGPRIAPSPSVDPRCLVLGAGAQRALGAVRNEQPSATVSAGAGPPPVGSGEEARDGGSILAGNPNAGGIAGGVDAAACATGGKWRARPSKPATPDL